MEAMKYAKIMQTKSAGSGKYEYEAPPALTAASITTSEVMTMVAFVRLSTKKPMVCA